VARPFSLHTLTGLLFAGSLAGPVAAADPPTADAVRFFETNVRPVLVEKCQSCHGPDKQKGGLRLDSRSALLAGGDSGPAAIPGKPSESRLVEAVAYADELRMPPKGKLAAKEIADLTAWVKMGAPWPYGDAKPSVQVRPAGAVTAADRAFWSFRPVADPAASKPGASLDGFIRAKLEAAGLKPAPPADKRTLLRRVTFDLTGLPPTPAEVVAFLADESPDAFATVVDRLLASSAYGEKWGRHWLDVARYADSNGSTVNHAHGNAWRYRDYVVNSFNADKPFDRFVREQLAGDLLPFTSENQRWEQLVGTGFLVLGPKTLDELDAPKMEMDIVDEQVDTTGRAFLGLTLGCARCHDHKFDPLPTADYYALAGIFKSTRTMEYFGRINEKVPKWLEQPLAVGDELAKYEEHRKAILANRGEAERLGVPPAGPAGEKARQRLKVLTDERTKLEAAAPKTPTAMSVREGTPADARVNIRGNHLNLGPSAPRGFPRVLAGDNQPEVASGSGRLELANWVASKDNPLTARVFVNRVWHWHFGRGLVGSPDNFGKLGEKPTHPELLDWLAARFVEGGWSVKKLHRLILLSATYRQAAVGDPATAAKDPENRLLGRFNRRRLTAEEIRDAALAVSGELDRTMGGSLLKTPNREYITGQAAKTPEQYDSLRRSVYLPVIRNGVYELFAAFDFPEPSMIAGRRATTTVPGQALFLINGEWTAARAGKLAGRLPADGDRLGAVYALVYGRPPTAAERERVGRFLREYDGEAWPAVCQALLASNEFFYVD
jgi:mono/diheme cytochrome c family protein